MTQNRRPDPPGIENVLANHAEQLRDLGRQPGQWIYVGTYPIGANTTPESPPFENGWGNVGGSFPLASFYLDKLRRVHFRGAVSGGGLNVAIFTLPFGYRPSSDERFVVPTTSGATPAVIEVVAVTGAVMQIA